MASLALPLGPLLRSMPPLRAYAIDIAGSMLGIAAFTLLSYLGTGPTAWFIVTGALLLLLALGAGPTPWSAVGRRRDGPRHRGQRRRRERERGRLVAVLPDLRPTRRTCHLASTDPADGRPPYFLSVDGIPHQQIWDSTRRPRRAISTARHTPGSPAGLRPRPDHRRRLRHRHGPGAGEGREARRRGRDRPGARADRPGLPSRGRLPRPAGHRPRQRRPGVPQRRRPRSTTSSSTP